MPRHHLRSDALEHIRVAPSPPSGPHRLGTRCFVPVRRLGDAASLGASQDSVDSGTPPPLARLGTASTRERRVPWRVSGQRRLRCAASLGASRDSVDSGAPRPLAPLGTASTQVAPRPLACLGTASTRVRRVPWRVSGQRRLGCAAPLACLGTASTRAAASLAPLGTASTRISSERWFAISAAARVISAANLRVVEARPAAC